MERFWILIGMMGAGKSTIGGELARRSGRPFMDTDKMLEARFGRSVPRIFAIYGEEAFRAHETNILQGLEPQAAVLSTGGGLAAREANWPHLRRLGVTVFLDVSAVALKDRLGRSKRKRPLLDLEDWEGKVDELLEGRRQFYSRADLTVPICEESVDSTVDAVLEALKPWN